jgi:hypothetical protein
MRLGLLILFILIGYFAGGQNVVSGVITDETTGEPIAFANVFFANTRIGVSSDVDGKFTLEGFPSGKYDLTIAYVGYTTYQQALEFNNSTLRVTVSLKTAEVRLREVEVKADTTGWARNFVTFKKYFLGETKNAKSCTILNPKSIHLYFDRTTNVLVAHAREAIQMENRALGFQLSYYLIQFELDFKTRRILVFGIPAFQNLVSDKQNLQRSWEKERLRAYQGSMIHFMRALRTQTLADQGFSVKKLYRIPNPDRLPQAIIKKKISDLRSKMKSQGIIMVGKDDSLRYYMEMNSRPALVDSLAPDRLKESEIMNAMHETNYTGLLSVEFKKEKEESGYLPVVGRQKARWQSSVIHFLAAPLRLYENGYYEDARNIFVEDYWAWSEKMADLFPLDYEPPISKRKGK